MQTQEGVNSRIRAILTDLDDVRENMLALSDEIWQSIDHNNQESLDQGYQFKKEYNLKAAEFNRLATELSTLVQQFTDVQLKPRMVTPQQLVIATEEQPTANPAATTVTSEYSSPEPATATARARPTNSLHVADHGAAHTLDESFTFKRPYGFILRDHAALSVNNWRDLYRTVWSLFAEADPAAPAQLANHHDIRRIISSAPSRFIVPLEIAKGCYVESNLSANNICANLRTLLPHFGFRSDELKIYLRN